MRPRTALIEILSASTRTRDRDVKRRLYERAGVREYWLVDPDLNSVTDVPPTARFRLWPI